MALQTPFDSDAYTTLGITPNSSLKEIERAYMDAVRRPGADNAALRSAYHRLRSPTLRLEDDVLQLPVRADRKAETETSPADLLEMLPREWNLADPEIVYPAPGDFGCPEVVLPSSPDVASALAELYESEPDASLGVAFVW